MRNDPMKLMVTIVPRGRGETVVEKYGKGDVGLHYVALGLGTANSEILNTLGIGETEKDVVFSIVLSSQAKTIMEEIRDGMSLQLPGRGIVFILSLSAVSKIVERTIHTNNNWTNTNEKEDEAMEEQAKYCMVVAVINRGYTDTVMDAAKEAGARGGTVIHARGVGSEEAGEFLGVKLQPEKEIVMMLVRQKDKKEIMTAIGKVAGMHSKACGFLLALPVEDFGGVS